ncbi:zinc-dependent metalloprotease [Psychroserpens sp.]|uniref:zinc-dependent metalloprotease n=1 Tax=Psychroserpens sp. TaxID=2020870 RepID=UPI001B197940|nr:zinc-dependent metalloprotease [Psychroserpens sp.]MBO6606581.1 zinc-dependent metalloprotease [Psychroserpens sp.]MBO6653285.1 zinc-dependent metalloprotease [Psychroserpens sp.]MBO6680688.1 zinc-dependent metalloprotease [Psychroserpens sp.]MBO6750354.1 zinc-dependent metalloprotease [Psychroserpens sp.]MBO6914836.1 zinc-dependent metalloprotease [Psychroserpens sp.]
MKRILLLFLLCVISGESSAQFLAKKELQHFEGYFNFHYEKTTDKIYLEVDKINQEFLYINSLATGVGSNDIGLDRGQLGGERLVKFERSGNKLLLVQPNLGYRANTDNALERKSIEQAFAKSVLYGFKILEEKDGNFIIDMTPFLMQDAHGVANRLKSEGTYKVDLSKSALALERTKAFPKNVEFEALLTFKGQPKGRNIRSVTPTASLVSVIQHHSFIELPDSNYKMRDFDPRSGAISMSFMDYATPIQEPIRKRYIIRHRLEKKNPELEISEAKEPIIYYLDPGTPEPVRSALLEGARWWNQAYEAIGYKDAFQVEMLPEDADPMDCRYNVIQWVHRSTRGWSYGGSVVDPRTGEIIKGHVSLGSLRIRQDFLIAQALMDKPFAERDDNYEPMLEMALARIRQLSAHEVGHTIGFAHNFAASTSNRASVMDYPHPTITLSDGKVDLSNAYATGIGEWDKVTVAYSYSEFDSSQNEKEALNRILKAADFAGLRFISDSDARPQGGAHALAHLWDNGKSASEELNNVLNVRATGIANFSKDNIRTNEPYSVLEDVFVPLYFFHRYQTEAAAKVIGGLDYNYAVKGDGQTTVKTIDVDTQQNTLDALLLTISAQTLAIPKEKLDLFPPRAFGYSRSRESFSSKTGVAFDPLSAAATASDMTLSLLLHPQRANRMIQQKSLDEDQLALNDMIQQILKNTFGKEHKDNYHNEIQQLINERVMMHLMNLAVNDQSFIQVKAVAQQSINSIFNDYLYGKKISSPYAIQYRIMAQQFNDHPEKFKMERAPKIPDGSPIGSDFCNYTAY